MKQYPSSIVEVELSKWAKVSYTVPSLEATMDFKHYLDDQELAFYNNLSIRERMRIHNHVNPFVALDVLFKRHQEERAAG